VVNAWNTLLNWVVSAITTNTFKSGVDKFWQNQNIMYNFTVQLHGTGSRSIVVYEESIVKCKHDVASCRHTGFGLHSSTQSMSTCDIHKTITYLLILVSCELSSHGREIR